jgi:SAM-dependent methyltransferase
VPGPGVWADLGSGTGAFTLALADLLGPTGRIFSVDRDRGALGQQAASMRARFPDVPVDYLVADFIGPLDLPPLDGIAIANALHFHRDKPPILARLRSRLRHGGRLILVEYDVDRGNPWVPHPISYPTWQTIAAQAGFEGTRRLATRPSRFLGQIYSALSFAPPVAPSSPNPLQTV